MRARCEIPLQSSTESFTHSISEQAIGKLPAPVHLWLGQRRGTGGLLRGVLNTFPETGMRHIELARSADFANEKQSSTK